MRLESASRHNSLKAIFVVKSTEDSLRGNAVTVRNPAQFSAARWACDRTTAAAKRARSPQRRTTVWAAARERDRLMSRRSYRISKAVDAVRELYLSRSRRNIGPDGIFADHTTVTSSVGARAPTVLFGTALILRHRQTGYHDIRVVREAQAIGPVS